jgi:nitronate monooxygenase
MTQPLSAGARRLFPELGLSCPLLLAGMGGIAGPELVAAVSDAGGAGVLGLYKTPPERIAALLAETERRTAGAYGLNWVPEILDERALLGRVEAALEASRRTAFVSFFGLPTAAVAERVRGSGRLLIVQVGTPEDAGAAVDLGADALIVQGVEAGGHLLGTEGVRAVLSATRSRFPDIALIAAGGISGAGDLRALVGVGADGACCGTLFIAAFESRAHPIFKAAVVRASAADTTICDIYEIGWPGRRHRVIRTPRVVEGRGAPAAFVAHTRVYGDWLPISRYSAAVPTVETSGRLEEMAFYCGTSCSGVTRERSAAAIVRQFRAELADHDGGDQSALAREGQGTWTSPSPG